MIGTVDNHATNFDSLIHISTTKFCVLHLVMVMPLVFELCIATLCYYKRLNQNEASKQESEFYRCRGEMWNINIVLSMSIINIDTSQNYYQSPIRVLVIIISRLIAAVLASYFLSLLRSSKLTISQYIYVRFHKIRYLVIVDFAALLLLFKSLIQSTASLERFAHAVKLTDSVQILIWFLYSVVLILVGGMRGWMWVASLRFVVIFACEIAIVIFIFFIGNRDYSFFRTLDWDALLARKKNKQSMSSNRLNWIMSFIYNLFYNLALMLLTDFSKYISCNKKGKNANWSMVLHVIPFSVITLCEGLVYMLMYMHYRKPECDPVGKGEVARYLLFYTFIDSISPKKPNTILHFIIGLKNFILGISTMPDIILTFYEKLYFILSKFDTFKVAKRREKFYVGHMIISISIVFISIYIFLKYISEEKSWLSQTITTSIFISSLLTTAVVYCSAMIPQMNANIFNFIPFFTLLVTLSEQRLSDPKQSQRRFGDTYHEFCNYFAFCDGGTYETCRYPCQDHGSDYFVPLTFLNGFLITFGFSLFITTVGKLSLKQLDPTLYIPCMLSFWQRRYASSFPQTSKPFKIIERPVA